MQKFCAIFHFPLLSDRLNLHIFINFYNIIIYWKANYLQKVVPPLISQFTKL